MPGLAPSQITHENQYTTMDLSYNLAPNVSMGEAKAIIDTVAGMRMPATSAWPTTPASASTPIQRHADPGVCRDPDRVPGAGHALRELIHPVTILSTLPAAGVGALLALFGTNTELSVISMIALVLLIGIVKKNAIMMIDFALVAQREHGLAPRDAHARPASCASARS
jgi:multidrug efflux pump